MGAIDILNLDVLVSLFPSPAKLRFFLFVRRLHAPFLDPAGEDCAILAVYDLEPCPAICTALPQLAPEALQISILCFTE